MDFKLDQKKWTLLIYYKLTYNGYTSMVISLKVCQQKLRVITDFHTMAKARHRRRRMTTTNLNRKLNACIVTSISFQLSESKDP